jgi:hypothetical protein
MLYIHSYIYWGLNRETFRGRSSIDTYYFLTSTLKTKAACKTVSQSPAGLGVQCLLKHMDRAFIITCYEEVFSVYFVYRKPMMMYI